MPDIDQLVLTVGEAAKALKISPAHAYALVAGGELPSLRLGRRILVPRQGLERLVAQAADPGASNRVDPRSADGRLRRVCAR
jgi:excisionase family DNA binding protein